VLLTLIGSGMEIQRVAFTNKPSLIQVGTSEVSLYRDAWTVEQVNNLKLKGEAAARVPLRGSPPP
jgi:hypothetical protein